MKNVKRVCTNVIFFKRQFVFFLFCFYARTIVYANEQYEVGGIVTDMNGEALVGAVVVDKTDNAQNALTDVNGRYAIHVTDKSTLVFSYLGYKTKEVEVKGRELLNVTLEIDNQIVDEVVVIGYGAIRKKDLLGAVSIVKSEDLRDRISGNIVESLRGFTSGMKITTSGLPGQNASIVIRGLGSLTNNGPLFIIDGMYGGNDVHVNVEDIESIQILKDASSASIYGSRAANGVVIISTKKGSEGPLKVKFDSQLTVSWLPRYNLMNAETWKKYNDMAYDEAMFSGVEGIIQRQNHYNANTDWQNEMLRTGLLQNYNLSLSGGSNFVKYFASINRLDDRGALKYTGYERWGFRINTSGEKGIFSYGENLFYSTTKRQNLNGNPWSDFIAISPTIPVYDDSHPGGYGYGDKEKANNYGRNLVAMQELREQDNPERFLRGNIYGQISLFETLYAKLNVAYGHYFGVTNTLRKKGNWVMGQGDDPANLTFDSYRSDNVLIEQTYHFKKKLGKHNVDALGGITYDHFHGEQVWTTKLDPLQIGDKYINQLGAATGNATSGGNYDKAVLISYLGRLNYSYDDKYLLQSTFRRDGTSRLPKKTRWGNFAALSLGWRISEESFFNIPLWDDLKIRANYGTLGNSSIGYWDYQSVINTAPRAVLGSPETKEIGMTQSRLTNNDLVWERKTTSNIGFDAMGLNNRLTLSAEYFYSKSKDLLVYLPILMSSGNEGGNPAVNAGSLSNKGFEIELKWKDKIGKDVSYFVSANVSRVCNKILDLGYGQTEYYESLSKAEIGKPLGLFYLYKMLGIFQSYNDVNGYVNSQGKIIQPNALPGDIAYDDYNDDGIISSADRQIVGNPWPDVELGVSVGLSYKGFDLGINGYGRFGHDVWNGSAAIAGDFADNQNNFNGIVPWTQAKPVTDRPRIVFGDSRNSRGDQDRWLEDGSFFRVGEIALGYTASPTFVNSVGFEQLRIGLVFQNMITFTNYSGLDPEFLDNGIFTIGADNSSFPNPRSIAFSLSFTF